MLELLRIRNLALIDDLELEFGQGLNVITGETGAGKSFILRALDFLLGEKLAINLVRPGREKARVEAVFGWRENGAASEILIRRELSAETGRSRVWVNDDLTSQDSLRRLRSRLILHASQHSQQELRLPSFHVRLLDRFLEQPALVRERDHRLNALMALVDRQNKLEERLHDLQERKDLLEYQHTEIVKVDPRPGEEETLEARKQLLRVQFQVQQHVDAAIGLLCAPDSGLHDALGKLRKVVLNLESSLPRTVSEPDGHCGTGSSLESPCQSVCDAEMLLQFGEHLHDLEQRLRGMVRTHSAHGELESIETRLWALSQLKRKLRRPLEEIVRLRQEVEANLSFLDASDLDLRQVQKDMQRAQSELAETLTVLDKDRRRAALDVCARLRRDLRDLGFSEHLKMEFSFVPQDIFPGMVEYRPRLLWAPNPGQPLQPLEEIASGGELSRVLLAIVGLMADAENPTLIFDEVDAGIGGMTLNRVGDRLRRLAQVQQVLVITHWPQLAVLGDKHFQVRKEEENGTTFTRCTLLEGMAREQELRRMTGGGWSVEQERGE